MNKIKLFFKNFSMLIKNNYLFFIGIIISSFIFLFSSSMVAMPFDKQIKNEITELITQNAEKSPYKLSLNSLELTPVGNSDYWIYTSNQLQDFQMRNQQYTGTRSYVFAGYQPQNNKVPFRYNNNDCTALLFESKFQQDNFYFNLPLLSGSLPRFTDKNTIYITDSFANKIKGDDSYQSLIGKTLDGQSISTMSASRMSYKIAGIFGTNNNLGMFLQNVFGDNIIFIPEYNSFQMNGSLYFVGSTEKEENKFVSEFITTNYKSSSNASRNLETGYSIQYKFFDFNENTNSFELGKANESMKNIINAYNNQSIIFGLLGGVLYIASFLLIVITALQEKNKINTQGKGVALFTYWILTCLSIILNSILYTFCPLISVITKTTLLTRSTTVSTIMFLSWILLAAVLSIIPFIKRKN